MYWGGTIYEQINHYNEAIKHLEFTLSQVIDIKIIYRVAILYEKIGDDESAIAYLNEILNIDENNKDVNIIKDEIIKIFPIGKHTMYEALITISRHQDNQTDLINTFYFLILVTPDNNIFNCDFFDITQISGTNISEDDKYEKFVLEQAKQIITKEEDIKALKIFIKTIRQNF